MIYRKKTLPDSTGAAAYFSECGAYRYVLHRFWKSYSKKQLVFVLLNPSTATEEQNDPTLIRYRNRAMTDNYYGVTIISLFAYRATDPQKMKRADEPTGGYQPILILQDHLSRAQKGSADIICGWGCHGSFRGQDREFLSWFDHYGIEPKALKVRKDGYPCPALPSILGETCLNAACMTTDAACELKTLRIAVTAVREYQRTFFATKSRDALARAKE